MWNTLDQQSMPEMPASEVQCKDLSDAILWLILMGIQDPSRFSWYENPPNYLLETARQKLAMLNLIELQSGLLKATPLGEMVAQIPLTASMARMCLISETSEQAILAARTAIILDMGLGDRRSGGDQQSENDLWPILEDWKQFPRHHPAAKAVDQILSILRSLPIPSNSVPLNSPSQMTSHEFTEFLCQAIPHLLCRRRSSNDPKADKSPRAILTNGKGMILKDESSVRKSEFFFALSGQARRGQDTLISCAVGIDKSLIFKTLDHQIKTTNETYYDRERQTFYTSSNKYFGSLLLERSAIRKATTQEVGEQLEQIALTELEYLVAQSEPLARLLARFRFLARELELIARDHTELAVIAREVLDSDHGLHEDGFHSIVSNVCYGENSLQAIIQKDWSYFFQDYVGDQIWKLLQDQVPQHVKTPRGKTILIEYPTDRPPFLEIKIQECFGWKSGPRVLFGHIPVRLHLLGPNYRPVQITDDLAGFWKGSYHEVRKELRARYPKHKWPEDPTSLAEED
jgi:ATP-dependent helicase HrpB